MGEMTEIQMVFQQRHRELAAERHSEKSDFLSALFVWVFIFAVIVVCAPVIVVCALYYGITAFLKLALDRFRVSRKG